VAVMLVFQNYGFVRIWVYSSFGCVTLICVWFELSRMCDVCCGIGMPFLVDFMGA
jgi:hypothetical protein